VLLVEGLRMMREALMHSLSSCEGIEVIGEAGDAATAVECARRLGPAVVVLDVSLPDANGVEVAAQLVRATPAPGIVAISAYGDRRFVGEMLRAGAAAYVTKSSAGIELVNAIRAVADGKSYFSPDVAHAVASDVRGNHASHTQLGRREREVLSLVARGCRSPDIAQRLNITVATVEVHRRNIMRKLGLHSVAELTTYAIREGLIGL
jgi:two-component system NarL family response regulator